MAFQTIVAPTLRELFIQQVIDMIFSGELKPGDKLPTERALSEQMNISRTMVHTGIDDLSRMGFLKIEPRKGVYVTDYSKTGNFETIGAIVRFSGKYNRELEYSLVELRNCIVGMAMRSLSKSFTKQDIEALRMRNAEFEAAISANEASPKLAQLMRAFETEIVIRSGNLLTPLLMNSFAQSGEYIWETCVNFWSKEIIAQQHKRIIELLSEGKGEEASQYIENAFEYFKESNAKAKQK